MKLQDILSKNLKCSFDAIAADKELAKQIQVRLYDVGLLDGPADGLFGKLSTGALKKFQILMKCDEQDYLGPITAKKLIEAKAADLPGTKIKLQNFVGTKLKYSFDAVGDDSDLTKQIQILLIDLGLLDPPADGNFGPITAYSLKKFQEVTNCGEKDYLGPRTAELLIETTPEKLPKIPLSLGNDLASRIIKYMLAAKYQVFQGAGLYNIVYVEGMDADGSLNDNEPNVFNDRRIVIEIAVDVPKILGNWEATTEPGSYYTYNPMNPDKGAARIQFGQYKAWQVGFHGDYDTHEALIQAADITVCRDFNEDFSRTGDKLDTGLFYIDQHWGYDYDRNDIYNASAGCLVGRARSGHREFMSIIKQDRRYQANNKYMFYTTVISGKDLLKKFPG